MVRTTDGVDDKYDGWGRCMVMTRGGVGGHEKGCVVMTVGWGGW